MKGVLNSTFLLVLNLSCWGQSVQGLTYWIPEKYVYELASSGTENECRKHLKPVQAIASKNSEWYVETFNGKFQPILGSGMRGAKNIPINELSLNLKFFTIEEQDSINQIKYHIMTYTDSIVLAAYRGDRLVENKKYIKQFKDYPFEELRKTRKVLLLQGRYNVYNSGGEKIEAEIEISSTGKIRGSNSMDSCAFKRIGVPDEFIYDHVEYYLNGMSVNSLAMIYDSNETTWTGYDYQVRDEKYTIPELSRFVFRLQKVHTW